MPEALNRTSINAPSENAIFEDLCCRFILNVPEEDQRSFERMLFLVESAHWFYEDNYVEKNHFMKSLTFKEFTYLMFSSCDVLRPYISHIDDIYKDFNSYKLRVPVNGAIILDQYHQRVLLVKGWTGTAWGFPRGKKSKGEEDHKCAAREVLEETGFDAGNLLRKEEYIETVFGQRWVRLYVVAGVKDDTDFAPLTKREISEIAWHRVDDLLPANDECLSRSISGARTYMVVPFLTKLKKWISTHQPPFRSDRPENGFSVWKAKKPSPTTDGRGKSFRDFRFDTVPLFSAMESALST